MAFLTGCSRSPSTAYAVPLAPAPSRAGAFCLERLRMWKLRPGIQPRNGMNFPNGAACGNCVPDLALRMGCAFPLEPSAEITSQNWHSERDVLSFLGPRRKLRPGIQSRSGMRYPDRPSTGSCVPESCLRMGCVFRWPVVWKAHPSLSVYSGMRFPLKDSTGKRVPF